MFGKNRDRWLKGISIFIGVVVILSMVVSSFAFTY
jgi:hypothetical protein